MLPGLKIVEYGIGYTGYQAVFKVWESHSWRAFCLGRNHKETKGPDSTDTVIPCFFDHEDYAVGRPGGYVLYLGRVTKQKGVVQACNAAAMAGKQLKVVGFGDKNLCVNGAEWVGPVDNKQKHELLRNADVLICPTQGIEPFGNVAVEAQLCGVPVVATNWGGFTETVSHGQTGWLCDSETEMVNALLRKPTATRRQIRERAILNWSLIGKVPAAYKAYFDRISLCPVPVLSRPNLVRMIPQNAPDTPTAK
jgi:glycosyltransferase involved in cell wall biosynthesis